MSDGRRGLPLLSGPPPLNNDASRAEIACRKCNKEFNIVFTRKCKCNHCGKSSNWPLDVELTIDAGYSYCSSCSDYQALMPRTSADTGYQVTQTGYEVSSVCAYCIENLNSMYPLTHHTTICIDARKETVTAAGRGQLRSLPLGRLRKYVEAYNIKVNGAIEKDDYIDHMISARVRISHCTLGHSI
jgi:hypothetical protein